ncbi:MAG: 16S rRNA (guanine(966)-N(2))-methyltransferase RsmD, partial [FCB group bacterium]|nr:16S rRNA (guanine(966)-N(2))-methyltransferase RsmD [FCB group bacterium]
MSIRVAGGQLRGRILKTVPGMVTRPTTGRVREAIFSILQHDLDGADVLDIFAGSGALAIEALSRGAGSAVLIEKGRQAVSVIKQNLEKCELTARLITTDYQKGLGILLAEKKQFDLIFADPPYELITP